MTDSRDRRRKVASLVYNDAANDSRVLKTAGSLADNGCDVAIVALARTHLGRPLGREKLSEHVYIDRVSEFSLYRMFPTVVDYLGRVKRVVQSRQGVQTAVGAGLGEQTEIPETIDEASADNEVIAAATAARTEPSPTLANPMLDRVKAFGFDMIRRTVSPIALASYWASAVREVRALRPDSIHANDANTLVPALIGSAITKAGVVYDSHELWRHRNVRQDRVLAPHIEALIERAGIKRSRAVITVSPSIATWLHRTYRLRQAPHLVRNIPLAGPVPDPARGQLRTLAGLDSSQKIVAYGGSITTSRGIEETLDALALLPSDTHLVLLGYGADAYIASLRERANRLGVTRRVHFVGSVAPHEVSAALADGDVAVVHIRPSVLSYRYALPNKLFESIRAGLPVVAADLPDISALVRQYGVGVCVDGEDPAQLAEALGAVIADGDAYRAAAHAAAPQLTWERESKELLAAHRSAWRTARETETASAR